MRGMALTPLIDALGLDPLMTGHTTTGTMPMGAQGTCGCFPAYDIERLDEHSYRLALGVPGYTMDDLDVRLDGNRLIITGYGRRGAADAEILHRGLGRDGFERVFELDDQVRVSGARLENGLLMIDLAEMVPEHQKPRKIAITDAHGERQGGQDTIEHERREAAHAGPDGAGANQAGQTKEAA